MAFVSSAIPNLIGGVSQQPPEIRALNCATALTNTWSDVVTGLSTRPAAMYLGKIGPAPSPGNTVATHVINKSSGDYHVSIHGGTLRVIKTTDGVPVEQTVTVEGGADAYLAGVTDAAANFGFVTVGDSTFIYNRSKVVTKTLTAEGSGTTGITDEGVQRRNPNRYSTIWFKQRTYEWAAHTIYYNGSLESTYSVEDPYPRNGVDKFATDLSPRSTSRISSTILSVQLTNEGDWIEGNDEMGNTVVLAFNADVEEFTDLPKMDRSGRLIMVRNGIEEDADDYWVWYKGGRWEETFGWNAYEKIDDASMPVLLVHTAGTDTWTLKYNAYPGREVGDADSNPTPSFVGRTIRSMFLYKGRMVILSDENFIASRISNFENFYRQTCTQLLDDDPIDIASSNSRGAPLNFGKEFNEHLLLFSAFDQFRVSADSEGLLSPNTVSIKKVNSYNNSPDVEPSFIGPNVAFVDDFGSTGFAALREYQVERVFGTEVSPAITDAVPEYIPSGVYKVVGSSTFNNLVLVSTGDRAHVWLYNYYFNSDGKVQSSWQNWSYTGDVFSVDYSRDRLMVTVAYDGDLHILQHVFDAGADTILDKRSILLDFGCSEGQVTTSLIGSDTQVVLPFNVEEADEPLVVLVVSPSAPGAAVAAQTYSPVSVTGDTLVFRGVDLTDSEFVVGLKYQFQWKPSPIYMRDNNMVAVQDGRLQLRRLSLLFNHSGPFKTSFTPVARTTYTSNFSGFRVGASGDDLGSLSLDSGEFKVAVNGPGERMDLTISAWTPWRVRFSTMEWDGSWRPKKRRT